MARPNFLLQRRKFCGKTSISDPSLGDRLPCQRGVQGDGRDRAGAEPGSGTSASGRPASCKPLWTGWEVTRCRRSAGTGLSCSSCHRRLGTLTTDSSRPPCPLAGRTPDTCLPARRRRGRTGRKRAAGGKHLENRRAGSGGSQRVGQGEGADPRSLRPARSAPRRGEGGPRR